MTNRRISDLTPLSTPDNLDLIAIVDVDEPLLDNKTKKITIGNLLTGIQIPYQTTGVAPISSPANGTLVLDNNSSITTLWARVEGAWVALITV